MDYARLKAYMITEVTTFGELNDADAATELMAKDKTHDLRVMSGKVVKAAFEGEATEWTDIGPEGRSEILSLTARDDLDPHGVDALIFQQAIGPNAPNALGKLVAARTITTSMADIESFGEVKELDVFRARALG